MSGKARRIGRRLQRSSSGCDKASAIPVRHGAEPSLALGGLALGIAALGGGAIGGVALGGLAIGVKAVGGLAVGIYSHGSLAIGVYPEGGTVIRLLGS